jgi:hypothetical protein
MNFEIAPKSTEIQANWDDARLYCFSLNIDGKIGWRLPSISELNQIYNSENDFDGVWYWSDTTRDNIPITWGDFALGQYFNGELAGSQDGNNKTGGCATFRAIRDLA